jgi:hypothetical protein
MARSEKFFHLVSPIETFIHMKTPRRDKKQKRQLTITYRLSLDGNNIRSAPDFVQTAYEGVKEHGERLVELKKEVQGLEIDILELPKNKSAMWNMASVTLENLAVKEISSGKGDTSIVLTCQSLVDWDGGLWKFMGARYGTTVYLRFDSSQASLLDLADEADAKAKKSKDQPFLPVSDKDASVAEAAEV